MPRKSALNPAGEAPNWLQEQVYAPKKQRTIDLVTRSVDTLLKEQQRVSLASIAAISQVVDLEGHGISESAILGNDEARAYYQEHRTWQRTRISPKASKEPPVRDPTTLTKLDRDEARVGQRYMRLSKQNLVNRLLAIERAYAEQEERWLRYNDDLLTWRLRAEAAEARLRQEHSRNS